jgi:hypothetical protein
LREAVVAETGTAPDLPPLDATLAWNAASVTFVPADALAAFATGAFDAGPDCAFATLGSSVFLRIVCVGFAAPIFVSGAFVSAGDVSESAAAGTFDFLR